MGSGKKDKKHFDSAHERYCTREFLLNLTLSEGWQLREWRISYHRNVLGKMLWSFFIRLLLSSIVFRSFCVTLCTYVGHSFLRNETNHDLIDISEIIHLTTTGHFVSKLSKCYHPSETQIHENMNRTGKKCNYYRNTNEIPYQVSFCVKTSNLLHAWKNSALPWLHNKSL